MKKTPFNLQSILPEDATKEVLLLEKLVDKVQQLEEDLSKDAIFSEWKKNSITAKQLLTDLSRQIKDRIKHRWLRETSQDARKELKTSYIGPLQFTIRETFSWDTKGFIKRAKELHIFDSLLKNGGLIPKEKITVPNVEDFKQHKAFGILLAEGLINYELDFEVDEEIVEGSVDSDVYLQLSEFKQSVISSIAAQTKTFKKSLLKDWD